METIKNLLRPGNQVDDETLYGQKHGDTTNTDTQHTKAGLTGEGSHLAGARDHSSSTKDNQSALNPALIGKGDGQSLPGSQPYPMNQGVESSNTYSTSNTSGPHQSDLANKADPRVDSDNSKVTGNDTLGSTAATGGSEGSSSGGRAFFLTPRTQGESLEESEHREYDPQGNASTRGVTTSRGEDYTTQDKTTVGPHTTDLANKADPRVDSDNSKSEYGRSSGQTGGYSSTSGGSYHTGPVGSAVGGPHQSDIANRLDPNVNNSTSQREDAVQHHEKYGGGAEQADKSHSDTAKAAGAGAIGLGAIGAGSQSEKSRFTDRGAGGSETAGLSNTLTGDQSMPGTYPESLSSTPAPQQSDSLNRTDAPTGTGHDTSSTGIPDRTRHEPTSTSTQKEHHYGRDAPIAGGAAGLAGAGAYGASRHSDSTNNGQHTSGTLNRADPTVDSSRTPYTTSSTGPSQTLSSSTTSGPHTSHATTTAGPHSSDLANRADPRVDSDNSKETHHGRDAAIGTGLAGAGAAGAYGATRHHDSNPQTSATTTTGPHSSDLANKADPRVDSNQSRDYGGNRQYASTNTTTGPHSSDLANKADPRVDSNHSKETHHGRDAAIGTGLVGAGAAGAYGASRHNESQPQGSTVNTTAGPHSSDLANKADPRVDSDRSKEAHHGRDAAVGTGVIGAGAAGAYGATKYNDNQSHPTSTTTTQTTTHTSTTTAGPHQSDLANKADPRVDSDKSKEKDNNYGRDAAVVGGVGAAAYGAHKYNERDDKESKLAQKEHEKQLHDAEKQRAHDQKVHDKQVHDAEKKRAHDQKVHDKQIHDAEKERAHAAKEHEKLLRDNDKSDRKEEKHAEKEEKKEHKGLFSFLHRDKSKKYSKEEEDEFDRQEREHNARNAAAGTTAGVGAGTLAAHEAHGDRNPHGKGHTPLNEQPVGSSIGDKLHGVERNRGVVGETGFPHGGAPSESALHHGQTDQADNTAIEHRGSTIGDKLHGEDRNRGVVGDTGFLHGDRHGDSTTGHHTTSSTGENVTTGHAQSGSQHTSARRPSAGDYNTDQQGNLISPTTAGNNYSTSTTDKNTLSTGNETAPRSAEQHLGGTPGQATDTGNLGQGKERNRLHKDPPAGHPAAHSEI